MIFSVFPRIGVCFNFQKVDLVKFFKITDYLDSKSNSEIHLCSIPFEVEEQPIRSHDKYTRF